MLSAADASPARDDVGAEARIGAGIAGPAPNAAQVEEVIGALCGGARRSCGVSATVLLGLVFTCVLLRLTC